MDRRDFLKTLSASLIAPSIILPSSALADPKSLQGIYNDSLFWAAPRVIRLRRVRTGEYLNLSYFDNGKLNYENYIKICYLLRDVKANQIYPMDLQLLNLIRAIQYYMEYHYGYTNYWDITSAYRSKATNAKTEGAALHSMHIVGKAIDFTVPGVSSVYMGLISKSFNVGGVGFYINQKFTHIDTGNNRYWVK